MYLNKAIIFGNLTRDPEVKALPSGVKVASFSIATNRVYKDKAGARQEQSEFHNVVMFGRLAELAGQYLKKGGTALIEGRLQTRSWEADGTKKYRTEILAETMQFGPRGSGTGGPSSGGAGSGASGASSGGFSGGMNDSGPSAGASKAKDGKKPDLDTIEYPEEEINPADIPF